MPILPVRDLAKFGVVTDVDPYDLPIGAWSMAINVSFDDGRISRGPIFRDGGALPDADPRYVTTFETTTGFDTVLVGNLDGRVYARVSGSYSDYSIAGYVPSSAEDTWTSTILGGCVYVNRPDRVPWVLMPATTQFVTLGGGWDSTWRAEILRAYNGALCAFNVTKGATSYPTLVKTSDIVTDIGVIPADWDHTDPTNNATENPLVEMKGGIIDAVKLGSAMIIYGRTEAWAMIADGSANVYRYERLPFNMGAINANCVVELENKHYVFGPNDLWVHDGNSHKSICDGRVRNFVFGSIDAAEDARCFVAHNENLKKLYFCFVSGDSHIKWTEDGCNRAAVYNYVDDKWDGFDDLPLVFSATMANAEQSETWASVTGTWATYGGSWQDLEGGFKRVLCFVGETSATAGLTATLYGQDLYGFGSLLNANVVPTASPTMTLERDGIDLDEVGEFLRGYKHVLAVYPQARLDNDAEPLEFAFGSNDYFGTAAVFSDYQDYEGTENTYKLDYTDGGRFLSLRIRFQDYKTMSMSGLDLDLTSTGER